MYLSVTHRSSATLNPDQLCWIHCLGWGLLCAALDVLCEESQRTPRLKSGSLRGKKRTRTYTRPPTQTHVRVTSTTKRNTKLIETDDKQQRVPDLHKQENTL